jgi:hypothetical protein
MTMTFNIGSQNAANINMVARDQTITGGQHGTLVTSADARQAVQDLRSGLAITQLDKAVAADVQAQVEEINANIQAPHGDPSRVARCLERLTRLLVAAGSLATAGVALIRPLRTLAHWLGQLGEPILRLLPA